MDAVERVEAAKRFEEAAMWAIGLQAASTGAFRPRELLKLAADVAPAFAVAAALRTKVGDEH
jgi:hypothetical protein